MFFNEPNISVPSVAIRSLSEFEDWCREQQEVLDERYRYEQALATREPELIREGTCALCLQVTTYTCRRIAGEVLSDGRFVPNWREELLCGCDARLSNRIRALVHVSRLQARLQHRSQIMGLGPPSSLSSYLSKTYPHFTPLFSLTQTRTTSSVSKYLLKAADNAFDIIVTTDYLQLVPPLSYALNELARVLAPGGTLVFTVPFYPRRAKTVSHIGNLPRVDGRLPPEVSYPVHEIGWDVIVLLQDAGFTSAEARFYWSEELGYLGTFNVVFSAVK